MICLYLHLYLCVECLRQIRFCSRHFMKIICIFQSINCLAEWGFGAAEDRVNKVVFYALTSPSLKAPLHLADNVVCCSLDLLEEKIPAIKQQPQEVFTNRKFCEFLEFLQENQREQKFTH